MSKVAARVGATANSYRVVVKLAVGGMAEIFLVRGATVTGVERYCVLKRILPEHAGNASFVQMFLDEARLATQLQHPNIASVYDIGMLEDLYFYTMEYIHGETVRSLVERAQNQHRPLPLACVSTIIAGAAAGLHHAHVRNANDGRPLGIVHRDVSPSNLMVSYEGNVKLVDFGVAKVSDRAIETRPGTVKGKIYYLSPEQCRGERVDRRSDLFSLGIVMWEMLTGTRLYRRATDLDSMAAIVDEAPSPPSSLRPDTPRAVDAIVLRLLAKSVADRFQTAAEVVEAIEQASIRGGTILSTAAVGRLIQDLFGPRAEPWYELERERLPADSMTLIGRPISNELPVAPIAAVPDASGSELAPIETLPGVSGTRDGDAMTLSIEVSRSVSGPALAAPEVLPPPGFEPAMMAPAAIEGTPSPLAASRTSPSRAVRLVVGTCVAVSVAAAIGVGLRGRSQAAQPTMTHEPRIAAVEQDAGSAPVNHRGSTPIPGAGSAPAEPAPQGRSAARETERPQSTEALAVRREQRGRDSITVAIDSDPPGAQVIVGGRVLGITPYHGELARQAHDVRFVIRLAAYAERVVVANASQAISERVKLVRSGTRKPTRPDPDRTINPF